MTLKRAIWIGVAVLVALGLVGLVMNRNRSKAPASADDVGIYVRTSSARLGTMTSVIEVSGDIKALGSTALSPKIPGRVVAVPYREGDQVSAGTVVVRQDTADLNEQVRQAEAGLQAAKARLSQALTSAKLSDTQTESQISQAKSQLDAAKARLQLIKKGARTEEIATAENAVASAKASFENAKVSLERTRSLYSQGAVSKQQMDLVQMQYDVASAQHDSARQQLSIVKAGAREEEIETAQKQVEQADEALRLATANRAQSELRQEEIKSARAGVAQAEAALAYARQQVQNAHVRTPLAGTITKRLTEPGQMASPGVPVVEIVALNTVFFEASVSEIDVHKVKIGQPVEVSVDALPGRKLRGSVLKVLPAADPKSRQFVIHIAAPNASGDLKPGMFARGKIETGRHENTVIISKDALVAGGKGRAVYVVSDSTARLRLVETGFETADEVEVLSGVSVGDELVVVGHDKLSDGVKVHVAD